ncbi:MAG: Phosphotransferase enzyme family protein [Frankiales bacterium]|nr:Phosphotransferase enzyme family protein [Frankiales bacterium]
MAGMSADGVEVRLGGAPSHVRRRGNVVTRMAGPWTSSVHSLLHQLQSSGVLVPEPFGVEGDREVLRFVLGDVPSEPYGADVWTDESLVAAARLLRRIHDATAGFTVRPERWQLPAVEPRETMCHNDMAPYNTVFRDGVPVGAIDWDTASPGPRLRDIAYVAYRWVPLQAEGHGNGPTGQTERRRRLHLMLESYGTHVTPADVVAAAFERVQELLSFTNERLDLGDETVKEHLPLYDADAAYLRAGGPLA